MDKILSINTIKNVFAALGAKTSDDNYAVGLFDKTTAEPKGLMEMNDLRSVLGVMVHGGEFYHGSLNTLLTPGAYGIRLGEPGNTITDYPSELADKNSVMLVFPNYFSTNTSYVIQLIMSYDEIAFIRLKISDFGVWKKIQLT